MLNTYAMLWLIMSTISFGFSLLNVSNVTPKADSPMKSSVSIMNQLSRSIYRIVITKLHDIAITYDLLGGCFFMKLLDHDH